MSKLSIGLNVNMIETTMVGANGINYHEQLPTGAVGKEEIESPELLAKFLKDAKKTAKIKGRECALVLPESSTYCRTVTSPVLTNEQIKINLPYEFKNYTGDDSVNYNYDYYIDEVEMDEEGNATGLKLMAAAAKKSVVEQYAEVINRAGMELKVALPKDICLINLMKKTAEEGKEICLIGLGYEYTNVYLFKGPELVATKEIELSTKDVDAIIAKENGIDDYIAATYRDTNHEGCLKSKKMNNLYDKISLEIVKTINFYRYENSETTIDTAYFFDIGSNNNELINNICDAINFNKGNIDDILPEEFKKKEDSARCLASIGLLV